MDVTLYCDSKSSLGRISNRIGIFALGCLNGRCELWDLEPVVSVTLGWLVLNQALAEDLKSLLIPSPTTCFKCCNWLYICLVDEFLCPSRPVRVAVFSVEASACPLYQVYVL